MHLAWVSQGASIASGVYNAQHHDIGNVGIGILQMNSHHELSLLSDS